MIGHSREQLDSEERLGRLGRFGVSELFYLDDISLRRCFTFATDGALAGSAADATRRHWSLSRYRALKRGGSSSCNGTC